MGDLRYDVGEARLDYQGRHQPRELGRDALADFNHRHARALNAYGLELAAATIFIIEERVSGRSNLGAFRNQRLREAVVLAAALPAAAVALDGRGSARGLGRVDRATLNRLKRANDRTAAQIMGEVLQHTAESCEVGEEVVIESVITEGVRAKPGVEPGGNPTIPVGALFGKERHCDRYGHGLSAEVTRLSLGSDVIDGTGKSVQGTHSSLTALFVSESGFKRHLPDIYIERWLAGAPFPEFNPRHTDLREEAAIIAEAYGMRDFRELTAYFLDRPRHWPAMDQLNALGVATPFDRDGDLFPAVVTGLTGLACPDGRGFHSMVGEIGGSAEWAISALPVVWRGGQSLGMLTSQSALTREGASPDALWAERFSYTEEELILISDARFEQKPFFTVDDIAEHPLAGGVAAFGAISDSAFLTPLAGVRVDHERALLTVDVLVVNSLGQLQHWRLGLRCKDGVEASAARMRSPKRALLEGDRAQLAARVGAMAEDPAERLRLRQLFVNEYYPAIVHSDGRMVVLEGTVAALIARGALSEHDRAIVRAVTEVMPRWFAPVA